MRLPISINGNVVDFKVDTGAEVTAITPSAYNLISTPKRDTPLKLFRGPNRKPLSTMGMRISTVDNLSMSFKTWSGTY